MSSDVRTTTEPIGKVGEQPVTGGRCNEWIIGWNENRICKRPKGHDGDHDPKDDRQWFGLGLPKAWDFNDEDLYDCDTDKYVRSRLVLECPCCGAEHRPLISRYTEPLRGGMRWVGCDHREPYVDYVARCPKTKGLYLFTTYTPQ